MRIPGRAELLAGCGGAGTADGMVAGWTLFVWGFVDIAEWAKEVFISTRAPVTASRLRARDLHGWLARLLSDRWALISNALKCHSGPAGQTTETNYIAAQHAQLRTLGVNAVEAQSRVVSEKVLLSRDPMCLQGSLQPYLHDAGWLTDHRSNPRIQLHCVDRWTHGFRRHRVRTVAVDMSKYNILPFMS